jgi:hypothetical protein
LTFERGERKEKKKKRFRLKFIQKHQTCANDKK